MVGIIIGRDIRSSIKIGLSKKRPIICGIYGILSPTGKLYIGQSFDIVKRFHNYYNNPSHYIKQPKLYNSLKKYSAEEHKYGLIHELPNDIDQYIIDEYEKIYINAYKELGVELLNVRGGGSRGKHSDESRKKMSDSKQGKSLSEYHRLKCAEANRKRALTEEQLLNCSKGGKAGLGGKRTQEQIQKFRDNRPNSMKIYCYTITDEFVGQYKSQAECARVLGLNQSKIHGVLYGKEGRVSHKGYKFKKM